IEKFGVPAGRIVDLLALMGDTIDNVPGVEKCGPKTAAKWIGEHGSLEGVIAAAPGIKGKIGDNLRAALDRLPLNRELVAIRTDVPLEQGPEALVLRERHVDQLRGLYARYGFNQALRELAGGTGRARAVRDRHHGGTAAGLDRDAARGRQLRPGHRDRQPRPDARAPGRPELRRRTRPRGLPAAGPRLPGRAGAAGPRAGPGPA